ncbi:MAG: phytanoyl-CoA dioxygenase family protein [Enhygromyxa sp.]
MLPIVVEDLYLSLYRELYAERFDSPDANAAVERLGAPARVIRALAKARQHLWAGARADLRASLDARELAPLVELVAGVSLFVVRDYDLALVTLARAAARGKPGVTKQALLHAQRFANSLGWAAEARGFEAALGSSPAPADPLDPQPARALEQVYALIVERGPELAAAALDEQLDRHGDDPAWLGARLRLDLLCDRPEQAEARLAAASPELRERLPAERATLALHRSDMAEVLALTSSWTPGTDLRLAYLRARALRELGDFSEAAELLEQARAELPRSPTIGLALALARHQEAPKGFDQALECRFEELLDQAPGLLSDAAEQLGVALWTDAGVLAERESKVELLACAEGLLTGELDLARPSYRRRSRGGELRLRHVLPEAPPFARLHEPDRKLIDHFDSTLVRALGVKPPRFTQPEPSTAAVVEVGDVTTKPSVWRPRSLSPEQIEQFLVDGFLVLPRAFDPEIARAWREDANRRIREEPERWVRGYDPNDEARSLRNYSPEDPSTWTWERIELVGSQSVAIEEFAPSAWGAICDLLGGPERIETQAWTNYLILNLRESPYAGHDYPFPGWIGWHLDDPSPLTRIDRIRNGLIGIVLFDRLLPRSGNTWLAPDSVAKVARELAAHPEGVDFVARRGNHITEQCERFHEVVGEVGDILLMHPLMLHSASPNSSGRIRWMSNPMVYLREPLDPSRAVEELSPVELAIHRALQ